MGLVYDYVDSGAGVTLNDYLQGSVASVVVSTPEPSTWAMIGLGFAGLALAGRRAHRSAVAA